MLISFKPDQEGNKLQRQNILSFIYPIYNNNWRNISTIYIYIYIQTGLASNEIFSISNKIHWELGRAKDLSAPLYIYIYKINMKNKNHSNIRIYIYIYTHTHIHIYMYVYIAVIFILLVTFLNVLFPWFFFSTLSLP